MTTKNLTPFNIDLLILTNENLKFLNQTTALDIFIGATKDFHPEGLFSTDIFGKYGEEKRNRVLSFIDMKITVFHPIIYKAIVDLKEFYGGIIAGTDYAVWNEQIKNFEKSTPLEGSTGFNFFNSYFQDIIFEKTNSDRRNYNIKLIEKFKNNCLMDKLIVIPAGLRDFEIDEYGKPSEDEINTYYRKAMSFSNLITDASLKLNPESVDNTRYKVQTNLCDLYQYIKNLLEGKKKLINGTWASRKIFNGTRNVITSSVDPVPILNHPKQVDFNQTIIGLFQYLKATLPVSMYQIKTNILSKIFIGPNEPAVLVNKKTLKRELVNISSDYFDDYMSDEGLEKTINYFAEEDLRHTYLTIHDHYLALIYKGPDGTFKIMQDIDELPEGLNKEDVHPLTFCEMLYIAVYKYSHIYPFFVTRYPITGFGSIYPTKIYLKTTIKSEERYELDDNWNKKPDDLAMHFPLNGVQFVNSMSPHSSHLARLGADFDGDMMSCIAVYSDESIDEVNLKLKSKQFYLDSLGKLNFSVNNDVVQNVLNSITGRI